MTATAAQIAQVRRMVAEPDDTTYDDASIRAYIEAETVLDADGYEPDDADYTATYDLNAAAAAIWQEKAAAVAMDFDFSADGGQYSRSQVHAQYMAMSRYYLSRRRVGTGRAIKWPKEDRQYADESWIINLPEDDD